MRWRAGYCGLLVGTERPTAVAIIQPSGSFSDSSSIELVHLRRYILVAPALVDAGGGATSPITAYVDMLCV